MADKTREDAIPVQSQLPFCAESASPANARGRTEYNYVDEQGKFLYQVVRFEGGVPGGSKRFFQQRKDVNDKWVRNLDGVRRVPYRLPELMRAGTVFVVEGEKDADRLVTLGLDATTDSGGAGKWHPEFARFFNGKAVVVLSDNDDQGRKHAQDVLKNLQPVAADLRFIELPGLNEKQDVSDWLDQGHTKEELLGLIANSQPYRGIGADGSILATIPNIWEYEVAPIEWAVEELIPMGCVVLLSGAPDAGKTCFAITLSRDIVHSDSFIGRRVTNKKVVYCDLENPLGLFRKRLDDLSFESSCHFHYWGQHCSPPPPQVTEDEGIDRYLELSKSLDGQVVFIFDTMVRFHSAQSENSASDMSEVMGCFRRIAQTGAAVFILHHRGKAENSQYRGSSDIQGAVDLSLMLLKDEKKRMMSLTSTKNRIGTEQIQVSLRYGFDQGGLAVSESLARERDREYVQMIRSAIEASPGSCQKDITTSLTNRVPNHVVRRLLADPEGPWIVRKGPHNRKGFFPVGTEPVGRE